ncbi:uncharacterized protein L201_006520 [Kwoniella dendrophila CBS 6074]|uniref:Fe2OG dioxygenase domain-containing protein n=1 Tax=Kwoniella dendrophila CBS 6074 TaxID=1295534 RepID=A0AAX4K2G4_9TREE
MVNTKIEDIKWVQKPWDHTSRINHIPLSSTRGKLASDGSIEGGHNQEILEFENGLILINDFLSNEEYDELLEKIKDEFIVLKEGEESSLKPTLSSDSGGGGEKNDKDNSSNHQTPKKSKSIRRQAIHYGPKYDYTTNHASPNSIPVPKYIEDIIDKMIIIIPKNNRVNQATIQFYPTGSGIPPHIDTHSCFDEYIISFSLGGKVNMSFQKATPVIAQKMFAPRRCLGGPTTSTSASSLSTTPSASATSLSVPSTNSSSSSSSSVQDQALEKDMHSKPESESSYHEIPLKPNSLCIMAKEIRYAWTHGIKSRSTDVNPITNQIEKRLDDRYSITFRKVDFDGKCNCDYGVWCDSQQKKDGE